MQIFFKLDNLVAWFTGAVVAVMIVHICSDVLGKYLLNSPVTGTITIVTTYYMPIITFLPLAYVQRFDKHISVEVLTSRLSVAARRHLYSWTLLLSTVVFAILTYYSFEEALNKMNLGAFQIEQGHRVPTWPGYFCLPIGYAMMAVLLILQFVGYLRGGDPLQVDRPGEPVPGGTEL